jgi:hypothetical protein
LVQDTAEIQNSTIRTNALTSIACLQDPTFGDTSGLHDTDFIQTGVGHAIELTGTTPRTFNGLSFTGYGADFSDDAALDLLAGSGTIDITIVGGATPTYKTAGVTPNFITGVITLSVTVLNKDTGLAIGTTARVYLERKSDHLELINKACSAGGVASETISYDTDTACVGWAREMNISAPDFHPEDISGTYLDTGLSITVSLRPIT